MRVRTLAIGLAAVLVFGACGDDNDSASSTTTAEAATATLSQMQLDKQKAQRVVLAAPDVPGYSQDPPEPDSTSAEFQAAADTCVGNNPLLIRLGTPGDVRGVEGPVFSKGDLQVTSDVTFGETEDEARTAFAAANAATFATCFSRAYLAELRKIPGLTNHSATTSKLPGLTAGDQSVGYRTVGRFTESGTSVTVNLDFTFIRAGRGMASLSAVSSPATFPEADRSRLAVLIAGRMAS
jgi:hypothetical protein